MRKIVGNIFIWLLALAGANPLISQTMGLQTFEQLRESPTGKNIIYFIEAINTQEEYSNDDVEKHFAKKLIDKHGNDMLLGLFADIKKNDGKLELYDANRQDASVYQLKCKGTRNQEWLDITLRMDEAPPHKIRGIDGIEITSEGPQSPHPMISVE